ncbi:MAG: cyclase family protein [Gammaproteobacteria bacterium]
MNKIRRQRLVYLGALLYALLVHETHAFDPGAYRLVDLTQAFNKDTIYWPTERGNFELKRLTYGDTPAGYFYSANTFCTPEHGGTHIDAPIHFARGKRTLEALPLERFIGPAAVIDIARKTQSDRDYRLTVEDILDFERKHGPIAPGSIALLRTGWSRFWPNRKQYLGDDRRGAAARLSFPSYGAEAARLLVEERRVAALGVDTASIDYGRSQDFMVHRIAAAKNVPGLENLTGLERLPARGATLIALPMKIEGGSGGPVRVVALIPKSNLTRRTNGGHPEPRRR